MTYSNQSLSAQLTALAKEWGAHTLIPDDEKNRAVEIGKSLHEAGGKPLMVEAYYAAKSANRCATVLRYYWSGIGGWAP